MFSTPSLFLIASVIGALFTLTAMLRVRKLWYFVPMYFFAGWLTSELAVYHLIAQAGVGLLFIANGALDAWPGQLGALITLASCAGLAIIQREAGEACTVLEDALTEGLGAGYRDEINPDRRIHITDDVHYAQWANPLRMRRPGVIRLKDIPYGDHAQRHLLDIYLPSAIPPGGCPVLLQIHGGAWMIGNKEQQALPLIHHLAARGWMCVSTNYRLSPKARFPDHLVDAKSAFAWIRKNAGAYGANTDFIAVTGGSAGGHLTALMGLTANLPELQPGFEDMDTTPSACVPFYGVYDFLDRHELRTGIDMKPFLADWVMPCQPEEDPALWDLASPLACVHPDAPPFFVIHGTHDTLAFIEDAQVFVEKLRGASKNPVAFAELPRTQHAFEVFHSLRTEHTIRAVTRFLEQTYSKHLQQRGA